MLQRSESAARRSFRAKVEILEGWVDAGAVPGGQHWPDGPVALRGWVDEQLGVSAWSSPNIASPNGPHRDLRTRYDAACGSLRKLDRHAATDSLEEELKVLRIQRDGLVEQNLILNRENRDLRKKYEMASQLLEVSKETEALLLRKVSKISPLHRVDEP